LNFSDQFANINASVKSMNCQTIHIIALTVLAVLSSQADVLELKDLKPGMKCPGIVTNVTNFGAFVDIGVHHDGLVHVSQLGARFVKDPKAALKPGDRVQARVLKVDLDKKQISLTLRPAPERKP
jgi:uncharacterized protein